MTQQPLTPEERAFATVDYQESGRYFLQIEWTMQDLLKFYSVLLVGLISASVALMKVIGPSDNSVDIDRSFALLWTAFGVVGFLLLYSYLELRIRKILVLEQIAQVRALFPGVPTRLAESVRAVPPYLRRPSAEWYAMIYMATANAVALAFALVHANEAESFPIVGHVNVPPEGVAAVLFLVQLASLTAFAFDEDLKREAKFGRPTYGMLRHRSVPWLFTPLELAARLVEAVERPWWRWRTARRARKSGAGTNYE